MSKRMVDLTVTNPVVDEAGKEERKNAYHAAQMPGDAGHYVGKKSGKPLKCDCGQPRKRGTGLCNKCKKDRVAESEAQHERYARKD